MKKKIVAEVKSNEKLEELADENKQTINSLIAAGSSKNNEFVKSY